MEAPAPKQPRKVQWWKDWRLFFFFNSYSTCLQKRKRSEKSSKKVNYWNVQTRKGIIGCIGWSWIVKKERWRRSRCWGIIVGVALSALVNCGSSSILGCRVKMEMERRAMSLLDLLERRIMMNTKIVFKNKGTSWFLQYHLLSIDSNKQNQQHYRFLLSQLSPEQQQRYEYFRRSGFQRSAIKRVMQSVANTPISQTMAIVMAGISKVYVGELVETGRW